MIFHSPEHISNKIPLALTTVQSSPNIRTLGSRPIKHSGRRGSNSHVHKHGYESDSNLSTLTSTSTKRTFPSPPLSPKLVPTSGIEQLLLPQESNSQGLLVPQESNSQGLIVPQESNSQGLLVQPVWPREMRTRQYSRQVRLFLSEYAGMRKTRVRTSAVVPRNRSSPPPASPPRRRRRSSANEHRDSAEWQVPRTPHKRVVAKRPVAKTHAHSNARPAASALAHAAHLASAEVVSRVPMYVPRESWQQLPDYAPPTTGIPRDDVRALRVEWHGSPTDLSADPLRDLLHPAELALAQQLRLPCDLYLDSKRRLFLEKVYRLRRGMPFRRTDAQKACRIDVNKASRLFAAFERVGWLRDSQFARYLQE